VFEKKIKCDKIYNMYNLFLDFKQKTDQFFLTSLPKINNEQKLNFKKEFKINFYPQDSSISISFSTKYFPKPIKLSFIQFILKNLLSNLINNETLIADIIIAIDEIVSNILEHSYKKTGNEEICFEFIFTQKKMIMHIKDFGPFGHLMDISKVSGNKSKNTFMKKKRGMGVYMVKKIMDQVEYEVIPDKYNLLTIIKNFDSSSLLL